MANTCASHEIRHGICTITLNDGGRNVISPAMVRAVNEGLDRAEKEKAVVILTGAGEAFSAGFDLKIMKRGNAETLAMLSGGFKLAERLLGFPQPVVIACNGHAMAMGAFLLLSGDYRLGAQGHYKVATNEVEIGLTMPAAGVELCRHRLVPAHFSRAVLLSELYTPDTAVEAGFLDQLVPADELAQSAFELAQRLAKLDRRAHYHTKLRARHEALANIKRFNITDQAGFLMEGVRRFIDKKMSS
jgi:enoyl-CoA hydratase